VIRTVVIGLWAALVALAASYLAATLPGGTSPVAANERKTPVVEGLEYRKPPAITVPMISDGRLRGYVVAKVVFTADARALSEFPIDPQPFVLDETFRRIYTDGKVEFDRISKYNLTELTKSIKDDVNKRLGSDLIQDILLDQLELVDKNSLKPTGDPTK
jgi:flagellar basal body-associated protein FliL